MEDMVDRADSIRRPINGKRASEIRYILRRAVIGQMPPGKTADRAKFMDVTEESGEFGGKLCKLSLHMR